MPKLQEPKNQFSLVVWLLATQGSAGVTMVDASKLFFHKYQTRQLEVEKAHPKLKIRRLKVTRKNKFGHSCTFTNYKSMASWTYLCNLVSYLNKNGLK